jgi:hypothetical protein
MLLTIVGVLHVLIGVEEIVRLGLDVGRTGAGHSAGVQHVAVESKLERRVVFVKILRVEFAVVVVVERGEAGQVVFGCELCVSFDCQRTCPGHGRHNRTVESLAYDSQGCTCRSSERREHIPGCTQGRWFGRVLTRSSHYSMSGWCMNCWCLLRLEVLAG